MTGLVIAFQSYSQTAPTKSPGRSQNGRDNTETIDMEMSDEDFETPSEFQEASESMAST